MDTQTQPTRSQFADTPFPQQDAVPASMPSERENLEWLKELLAQEWIERHHRD